MIEGTFNHGTYWHAITSSLFQGASIIVVTAAIVRMFLREGATVRGIDIVRANGTLVVLGGVFALAFAVLATITGIWMTWGFSATTSASLTMNKSMFATFGILALVLMLLTRYRFGPGLWRDPAVRGAYVALAVIQGLVAAVNGSLGGEAGLLGTIFDPVWRLLGIQVSGPMVLPQVGALILLVLIVAGALGLVAWRLSRRTARPASG